MKILVMPDAHLKCGLLDRMSVLLDAHPDWGLVSLGDWVDDWNASPELYKTFLNKFADFLDRYGTRCALVWGNHDWGYWEAPGWASGYSSDAKDLVRHYLADFQTSYPFFMVYGEDNVVFSHAGVTKAWFATYKARLSKLSPHTSLDTYTRDATTWELSEDASPLWHRPADDYSKNTYNPHILQVVGHTPVSTITHTTEDNILYSDTWSTDSEHNPLGDKSLVVVDTKTQEWEVIPYE